MTLTVRVLPPEEYAKIADTDAGPLAASFLRYPAVDGKVYVAEDGDTIVGVWTTFQVRYAEGLWIEEGYGVKAGYALWNAVKHDVADEGYAAMATATDSDHVQQLLRGMKAQTWAGHHFYIPVTKGE
jgi:hypothetical protein